jgi:hypothetical protein
MTFDPINPIKPWDGVKKARTRRASRNQNFSQKINQAEVLDLVFAPSRMVLQHRRGAFGTNLRGRS